MAASLPRHLYPIFKPVGHLAIAGFDVALAFFYYRRTADDCFFGLKFWVYGQGVLHA